MHDLRLIGVHEDGRHVLLADDSGTRYRLPLDEALRAAARRDRPRLGQLQIEIEGGLRPREVQALVRRGLSTQEVAERAGWTVEKVRRFEGPVLAEREFVATQARRCLLGTARDPQTLGDRVDVRLRGRGVERGAAEWDSARDEDGHWTVTVTFPAGGRSREARWAFDHLAGTVVPLDDEARWLGEDTTTSGPIPTPHMATAMSDSTVFDVEASGGLVERPRRARPRSHEPIDLLAAMRDQSVRSRRSRRRSTPAHVEDTLDAPLPLDTVETAASPAASRAPEPLPTAAEVPELETASGPHSPLPDGVLVRDAFDEDVAPLDPAHANDDGPRPAVEEPAARGAGSDVERTTPGGQDDLDDAADEAPAVPAPARRPGRPSLPRWEEIVFGASRHQDG